MGVHSAADTICELERHRGLARGVMAFLSRGRAQGLQTKADSMVLSLARSNRNTALLEGRTSRPFYGTPSPV